MRAARRRLPLVDFAGCRVSDVSWLLLDQTQVSRKAGWMTVGHKGGKERTIDLVNEVRSPLYEYLHQGEHKGSAYVFTSQRVKKRVSAEEIDGWRWTEDGIHQWWQQLKARTRLSEARFINNIDFHESRSRLCSPSAGSGLEPGRGRLLPGTYYQSGMPAIQTTIRYTQVSREHVKEKLKLLRG